MAVLWGFAEVTPTKVTVMAEIAEKAEDIDVDRAQRAVELAEQRLKAGGLPSEVKEARNQSRKGPSSQEDRRPRPQDRTRLARGSRSCHSFFSPKCPPFASAQPNHGRAINGFGRPTRNLSLTEQSSLPSL